MIIDTAEKLLVKGGFPLPSVNQIIAKAGVAKGTVYLYFTSKEEIYLSLLAQYYDEFTGGFFSRLGHSNRENLIDNFSREFLQFAEDKPKAVYLASIVPIILENNVSDDYLIGFKKTLLLAAQEISNAMAKVAGSEKNDQFLNRFMLSFNQFSAFWQHCNPPEHAHLLMREHGLGDLIYDFEEEFTQQMQRTWADLI